MDILMLKNIPVLKVHDDGKAEILEFSKLPFALRTEAVDAGMYHEWVSQRALQLDRQNAKELINRYRLPQYDKYRIAKACRAFSLNDAYWIKYETDTATWESRNLFHNEISVSIIETSLSGRLHRTSYPLIKNQKITEISPELTTWGVNAKAWMKEDGQLYLHKVGINELGASQILDRLEVPHVHYRQSTPEQISRYVSEEIQGWLEGTGETIVNSKLFTSPDVAFVSFDEFGVFCEHYHLDPIATAMEISPQQYHEMQVIDYILNNSDRHGQNWGFYMDNASGKLAGMALHFDHDKAFNRNREIMSLTSLIPVTMKEAALNSLPQSKVHPERLTGMEKPPTMTAPQWLGVQKRTKALLEEA